MARALRVDVAGGWYHVINRGIERRRIFSNARDCERFIGLLAAMPTRFGMRIHAFVLMPNHYHLQVETQKANLSQAIHWLNVSYSVWFNQRHHRVGSLFQGRFKAVLHEETSLGVTINQYIHLNPVRVKRFGTGRGGISLAQAIEQKPELRKQLLKELRSYQWSSLGAYAGQDDAYDWLTTEAVLSSFVGNTKGARQRAYVQRIEEMIGADHAEWKQRVTGQVFAGSAIFVQQMKKQLRSHDRKEQKGARQLAYRQREWTQIVKAVERVWKEPWQAFVNRHGDAGRDIAMLVAREGAGMRLREIGQQVGTLEYPAVSSAIRLLKRRLKEDKSLFRRYRQICHLLYF
jgi:putative transposase